MHSFVTTQDHGVLVAEFDILHLTLDRVRDVAFTVFVLAICLQFVCVSDDEQVVILAVYFVDSTLEFFVKIKCAESVVTQTDQILLFGENDGMIIPRCYVYTPVGDFRYLYLTLFVITLTPNESIDCQYYNVIDPACYSIHFIFYN